MTTYQAKDHNDVSTLLEISKCGIIDVRKQACLPVGGHSPCKPGLDIQ